MNKNSPKNSKVKRTKVATKESGVAIPEFMITFPVLLFLLFGSIDLGSLLQQYLLVQHAATIGAEKIQTLPSLTTGIIANCKNADITANTTDISLLKVKEKMNSVLAPASDKLNTSYTFCQTQDNGQTRIQVLVAAEFKNSSQLLHLKGARLTAKVEVPYFFGS